MTTIAYVLLVHKNPQQVARLLKNIYSSKDFFYVCVFGNPPLKKLWIEELKPFKGDNFLLNFKDVTAWGAFPVVDATLEAMRKFSEIPYDYFINLTGQCYPLKSLESIKTALKGKDVAYLESFKVPEEAPSGWGKQGGLDRFEYSYYKNIFSLAYNWILGQFRSKKYDSRRYIKIPKIRKSFPYGLKPYGGSAYFCLPKRHVEYILHYLSEKPDIVSFLKRSFAPDELFFQTIIMNSPFKGSVVNDNLRCIDWTKKGVPLPAILTMEDKYALLASPKLLARKFDSNIDAQILDVIDLSKQEDVISK